MGNKRKPRNMKLLEGTARKDRDPPQVELPEPGSLAPPDWLDSPPAVDAWNNLVGILAPVRVLSDGDLLLLGHLCNLHAHCVKRWRLGDKPNDSTLTALRLGLVEFGLTPASRAKAGVLPETEEKNAFKELAG